MSLTPTSRRPQPRHNPLKHKHLCLTDTPTDQTSNDNPSLEAEKLQRVNQGLQQENAALKETILQMKASEFYGIDQQKVKALIVQNEDLKRSLNILKQQLDSTMVEKDFLERNDRLLRNQYE